MGTIRDNVNMKHTQCDMEKNPALLALYEGGPNVTMGFPNIRPEVPNFVNVCIVSLKKMLNTTIDQKRINPQMTSLKLQGSQQWNCVFLARNSLTNIHIENNKNRTRCIVKKIWWIEILLYLWHRFCVARNKHDMI